MFGGNYTVPKDSDNFVTDNYGAGSLFSVAKIFFTEAGILVENFYRQGRALKSTLNFLGRIPCLSLICSDRDRSLKQVRTLGTLKFRPLIACAQRPQ
jgi:hypothetical protein